MSNNKHDALFMKQFKELTNDELQKVTGGQAGVINKYGQFITTSQINYALQQAQLGNLTPYNSLGL